MGVHRALPPAALEDAPMNTKNAGTKNTASTVALIMPAITPVPMRVGWLHWLDAAPAA
jgi:hypothetical protein